MADKLITTIICILYFSIMTLISKRNKMLNTPGYIMVAVWSFFCTGFLIFDDMKLSYAGIYWILIATILYYIGCIFGMNVKTSNRVFLGQLYFKSNVLRKIIFLFNAVLIPYGIFDYFMHGGVSNVANVAMEYYSTLERNSSVQTLIFSLLAYSSALFGGIHFFITSGRKKYFSLLVFVYPIITMATTSGKLGFILAIILFVIGLVIASLTESTDLEVSGIIKITKKYGIYFFIVLVLLYKSLLWRMGSSSDFYKAVAKRKMLSYIFGSPAAFCSWFHEFTYSNYELGKNTFMVFFKLFGGMRVTKGVYNTLVITDSWYTNVYTAFRGIITDYGRAGGLLFILLIGVIAGTAFRKYRMTQSIFSCAILSMSYLFVLYSFIISPFIYTNLTILMFVVVGIYNAFDKVTQRKA